MRKVSFLLGACLLTLLPIGAFAASAGILYGDANVALVYSSPKPASKSPAATLMGPSAGITLGAKAGFLMFGVAGGYTMLGQQSTIEKKVGNFGGSRYYAAPVLGLVSPQLILKLEPEFFGNYNLSKETATGEKVAYKSPRGIKATALVPLSVGALGAHYEYVSYKQQWSSSLGFYQLPSRFNMWQVGAVYAFIF